MVTIIFNPNQKVSNETKLEQKQNVYIYDCLTLSQYVLFYSIYLLEVLALTSGIYNDSVTVVPCQLPVLEAWWGSFQNISPDTVGERQLGR